MGQRASCSNLVPFLKENDDYAGDTTNVEDSQSHTEDISDHNLTSVGTALANERTEPEPVSRLKLTSRLADHSG